MNIVILAAGQGKRMYSNLPKVLHPLAGKALVSHVIDTARALSPRRLCIVYGHGGDAVRAVLDAPDLSWALQGPQLGTGHAVRQALPFLEEQGTTLVLYGDVPLIQVIAKTGASGSGRISHPDRGTRRSARLRTHHAQFRRTGRAYRRAKGRLC